MSTMNLAATAAPPSLAAFWPPGQANLIDTGAIMAFESGPGPPLDGIAQPGGSLVTVSP